MYTVDEGGLMAFCVEVAGATLDNCLVNVPFNISFTTVGGSAGILCLLYIHVNLNHAGVINYYLSG